MPLCSGRRANRKRCYFVGTVQDKGRWYCRKHKPSDNPKPKPMARAELLRLAALSPSDSKDRLEIFVSFHTVLNELLTLRGIRPPELPKE